MIATARVHGGEPMSKEGPYRSPAYRVAAEINVIRPASPRLR
jgi:hypothetical protein